MKACSFLKWHCLQGTYTLFDPVRCHRCVIFFECALDFYAHENWSYSSEDRIWNKSLNWICWQLVPLHLIFFKNHFFVPLKETSLWEYVIIQKHPVGCSIDNVSKALKRVERAVIKMLLLLSYSGMYQKTHNELKYEVISANVLPNKLCISITWLLFWTWKIARSRENGLNFKVNWDQLATFVIENDLSGKWLLLWVMQRWLIWGVSWNFFLQGNNSRS